MSVRKSSRVLRVTALGGGFLFVAHSGCLSNLDDLSSEYGEGGSAGGSAGTASGKGGSAGKGSGGSSAGEGSGGSAGDGKGAESGGGEAGARASGGSSGEAGEGAASGASGDVGVGGASGAGTGGSEAGQAGTSSGAGGEAGASCDDGLVICPGTSACVDLDMGVPDGDGVTHCGTCGETCSLENASAADCVIRKCVPTCVTGFDDCNPDVVDDGCETSITTASNCGACGFVCSNVGATSVECPAGRCEPACIASYGDCNSGQTLAVDDGCESFLDSLTACRATCGSAPVDCAATEVCNAGECVAPQGVVMFSVPLTQSGQEQRYADTYNPFANLEGTQLTIRLYAPGATGGGLRIYLTDVDFSPGGNAGQVALTDLSHGFTDITFSAVGDAAFDPTQIRQLNLEVVAASSTSWTDPTVIYVDSVRSANNVVNHRFDVDVSPMVMSSTLMVEGSSITWLPAIP